MKKLFEKWKQCAAVIGNFMSGVVLTLLYFVLCLPYGIVMTFFADPLSIKSKNPVSGWKKLPEKELTLEMLRRQ